MHWNRHLGLQGEHAFLSPSSYHWINYTRDRLEERWTAAQAGAYGIMQHEYAKREIEARRRSNMMSTIGMYINDAIRYRMSCEQVLFYSEHCFGTVDAISFRGKLLRIHDLKTGITRTSVHQLEVYAALFCLEYNVDPFSIRIELRIYQSDEVARWDGDPEDVATIMARIVEFDQVLNQLRLEEES